MASSSSTVQHDAIFIDSGLATFAGALGSGCILLTESAFEVGGICYYHVERRPSSDALLRFQYRFPGWLGAFSELLAASIPRRASGGRARRLGHGHVDR